MENVEAVDVSWLHHTNKGAFVFGTAIRLPHRRVELNSTDPFSLSTDNLIRTKSNNSVNSLSHSPSVPNNSAAAAATSSSSSLPAPSSRVGTALNSDSGGALHPAAPAAATSVPNPAPKKPAPAQGHNGISLNPNTPPHHQQQQQNPQKPQQQPQSQQSQPHHPQHQHQSHRGRRNSWISNLSSRFSGESRESKDGAGSPGKPESHGLFGSSKHEDKREDERHDESATGTTNQHQKNHPGFFHNALRRLSAPANGLTKMVGQECQAPRRIMNVDPNRDRSTIPELNSKPLKRVAFHVDVEIAGPPRLSDSEENVTSSDDGQSTLVEASSDKSVLPDVDALGRAASETDKQAAAREPPTKKQEKKKRSEEERKERRERKRRQAEANGIVPLQLFVDSPTQAPSLDRPTTDPVRIYRRCCQLRETGVLKRIVAQISSTSSITADSPGTVAVLDLTGFVMKPVDIVTFSDWLAIVPVRKLVLQNCGLNDESVRTILAGLLATKTVEALQYRRIHEAAQRAGTENSGLAKTDRLGAIEKLVLRDNPKIGPEGWRHIALFIHMSRSLVGVDLSGIPFPKQVSSISPAKSHAAEVSCLFSRALGDRLAGDHLQELVLSECYPLTEDVQRICDASKKLGLRRLGLADNALSKEGLEHVVDYMQAGSCEGLDLGGNDMANAQCYELLASGIPQCPGLLTLSLADCSLTPQMLATILQALVTLPVFRFLDLSHNRQLFVTQPDSLSLLRRFLPRLRQLRRIHLVDVSLMSDHAIALAEILPECQSLCHINILENPKIEELAHAKDAASQEEACALYASLMTAARIMPTLIAVDIDVPSSDSNEVVKALASQIVAYSLKNLEEMALGGGETADKHEVPVPEILQHLVGTNDDSTDDVTPDENQSEQNENYVIGGTGVVKALGVFLGNVEHGRDAGGEMSPLASGTSSPRRWFGTANARKTTKQPRDMTKNLLNSARKIRARLHSALVKEDSLGNDKNYRKSLMMVLTLWLLTSSQAASNSST